MLCVPSGVVLCGSRRCAHILRVCVCVCVSVSARARTQQGQTFVHTQLGINLYTLNRKQIEQKHHDLLANKSAVASMSAITDELQCGVCLDLICP